MVTYPSCRYIGSDKAIADLPFFNGNVRLYNAYVLFIANEFAYSSHPVVSQLYVFLITSIAHILTTLARSTFSGVACTSARSSRSVTARSSPRTGCTSSSSDGTSNSLSSPAST